MNLETVNTYEGTHDIHSLICMSFSRILILQIDNALIQWEEELPDWRPFRLKIFIIPLLWFKSRVFYGFAHQDIALLL